MDLSHARKARDCAKASQRRASDLQSHKPGHSEGHCGLRKGCQASTETHDKVSHRFVHSQISYRKRKGKPKKPWAALGPPPELTHHPGEKRKSCPEALWNQDHER